MADESKQPERLLRRLRDEGVPPARDLMPEINEVIDREEERLSVRSRATGTPWPRLLAVAAALAVVLVAAWTGVERRNSGTPTVIETRLAGLETPADTDQGGGLGVIDQALDELNAALTADPENQNLSKLVLMIHQKRGDLLRRTEGTWLLN